MSEPKKDKEITKDTLYLEIVNRVKKQLKMIEGIEAQLEEHAADPDTFVPLTKAYNNIVQLYNQTCQNLIALKRWNYVDEEEKKNELDLIRKQISEKPLVDSDDVKEEDDE